MVFFFVSLVGVSIRARILSVILLFVLQSCGSHLRTHFKNTRETAKSIAGMGHAQAKQFLEDVIAHKRCVVMRRFAGSTGRTAQAKMEGSTNGKGRWPQKSCKILLSLLENAVANAEVRLCSYYTR